jgi:hypothetical protein
MRSASLLAAALLAAAPGLAQAATVTLDFEGVGNGVAVDDFYNGGAGTNYGISFVNGVGLVDSDAGGSGNFANEPTADTVVYFTDGAASIMNVVAGFVTGFSFFYGSNGYGGSVDVFDGLNGTGTLLATLALPALTSAGNGDPNGDYDTWENVGVTFTGTAYSVSFGGTANQIAFDNITLGSSTAGSTGGSVDTSPVPLPASAVLLMGALGGLGLMRRRKRG